MDEGDRGMTREEGVDLRPLMMGEGGGRGEGGASVLDALFSR